MNSHNMAMAALRAATHEVHQSLEQRLAIALPGAGKEEYLDYLKALWGWLAPIEQRLWEADWPSGMHPAERDGKRFWITEDLKAAGLDDAAMAALPQPQWQPPLASREERFGWAYVIEGAQLGTQVLRKALAPALADWEPRWLQGYGGDTSKHWKAFMQCAEAALDDTAARDAAAGAASAAFRGLTAWMEQCGAACSE